MNAKRITMTAAVAGLVLAGAACSNSGQLSVSATPATVSTETSATPGSLDLGQGILVERVRIAVIKVALEGPEDGADAGVPDAGDDGGDDGGSTSLSSQSSDGGDDGDGGLGDDDGDENEVKVGPFLVDLTGDQMAAGIAQVFDADVPAGTYREIKFVIGPVSADKAGSNAGLVDMNGSSVIIDGTVDGTPFSFASSLHVSQKTESTVTVATDGSTSNVTLRIDPTSWFTASDGSRIDPSVASNKDEIENAIKASVKAFCDRDRDGDDDHGRGGNDDGPNHT